MFTQRKAIFFKQLFGISENAKTINRELIVIILLLYRTYFGTYKNKIGQFYLYE